MVALWICLCTLLSCAGWLLSAVHALHRTGYLVVFVVAAIAVAIWQQQTSTKVFPAINARKLGRRFRRLYPFAFLGLAGLAILGGIINPPNNYDALAYRVPRMLHWLAAEQWHWVHADFPRLNTRSCGTEWVLTPMIAFLKTDRWLFVSNAISFLLLPGLIFSLFTRVGVRRRVAWHWMWLLPSAYGYLLQAGSIANDIFGVVFPLAALGDKWGCRNVYCGGLLLFIVASACCAYAQTLPQLVAARIVQGVGASAVMSVNLALIRFIFPAASLGRGIAFNTLIVGLAATAGPTVAAAILSFASWPVMFLINVPLGLLAFVIGMSVLPVTPLRDLRISPLAVVLNVLAFAPLVLALDRVGRGASMAVPGLLAAFSALAFLLLYRVQMRDHAPIVPFDLLRQRTVRIAALVACLTYVVQGLSFTSLPFLMHDEFGYSPAQIGLSLTPWALAIVLCSPWAGLLSDRFSPAIVTSAGLLVLTLGVTSLLLTPQPPTVAAMMARTALCGIGFAFFQVPNSKAIVMGAPLHRSAAASAIQSAARLSGQTGGAAMVATAFGLAGSGGPQIAGALAVAFAVCALGVSALRLVAPRT